MTNRLRAVCCSLFLCTLAVVPAAVAPALAETPIDVGSRQQLAEHGIALDARQIEQRLYRQGYQRISHIEIESGAYTVRALDEHKRPVFLGVSPDTGEVIEAHPMR